MRLATEEAHYVGRTDTQEGGGRDVFVDALQIGTGFEEDSLVGRVEDFRSK
jgi:hypothetical protein